MPFPCSPCWMKPHRNPRIETMGLRQENTIGGIVAVCYGKENGDDLPLIIIDPHVHHDVKRKRKQPPKIARVRRPTWRWLVPETTRPRYFS